MDDYTAQAIASVAVCGAGVAAMYITEGESGTGWAILGILLIWS